MKDAFTENESFLCHCGIDVHIVSLQRTGNCQNYISMRIINKGRVDCNSHISLTDGSPISVSITQRRLCLNIGHWIRSPIQNYAHRWVLHGSWLIHERALATFIATHI